MKKFQMWIDGVRGLLPSMLITILLLGLVEHYGLKVFSSALIGVAAVALLNSFEMFRDQEPYDLTIRVPDWEAFWTEFLLMSQDNGFSPVCQMDQTYFFQRSKTGPASLITLRNVANDQWKITYPRFLHGKMAQHFSAYTALSLLATYAGMEKEERKEI